jgi:hypothetical protein
MSWSELQRLVEEAEADGTIRRALRRCRSPKELLMACRRLGYGIQAQDLRRARALERTETTAFTPAGRGMGTESRRAAGGG